MGIYWIEYRDNDTTFVFISDAPSLVHSTMKAALAGARSELTEGYELDAKTAEKLPEGALGLVLTKKNAAAVRARLDAPENDMAEIDKLLFYAGIVANTFSERGQDEAMDGATHLLAEASKADILAASNILADPKRNMPEVRRIFMDVAKRKQSA